METKRNLKYFTTKGINIVLLVGLAVCVIGFLMMLIIPKGNGYNFGFIVIMIGAAVAVFGSGAKSAEADIDNQIHGKIKEPFVIDLSACIRCGSCVSACAFHAIKEG